MYEELVKRLRNTYTLPPSACALMNDAADAIEELSYKYQEALDDLVKQAYPPKEET